MVFNLRLEITQHQMVTNNVRACDKTSHISNFVVVNLIRSNCNITYTHIRLQNPSFMKFSYANIQKIQNV